MLQGGKWNATRVTLQESDVRYKLVYEVHIERLPVSLWLALQSSAKTIQEEKGRDQDLK